MASDTVQSDPAERRPWWRFALTLAWVALGIAYACLMALATATHHARPAAWLLIGILAFGVVQALYVRQLGSALFAGLNLALVAMVFTFAGPFSAIGLTTAIIQAGISAIFFRGLGAGKTDVVTRMACAIRPERSARELRYSRRVAWTWAWTLAVMSAVSLAVIFTPGGALWWWWMNVVSYSVPIGLFSGEWLFRHWYLRDDFRASEPIDWQRVRNIDYARLFKP
ncbi:MAG: hypothetical protein WCB49_06300 [Gammaproteobacteria bacterium]